MSQLHAITGVRISLASPALIRSWSSGEVIRPETINFATHLPEPGGLFCQRIFGPLEDDRCACTDPRYKPVPGTVCEKCGVEVTASRVRRERVGHIELAVPIVQSWFAHGTPSILAILLDVSARQLSSVLAYTGYLVTSLDKEAHQRAIEQLATQENDEHMKEVRSCLASLHVGSFLPASLYWDLVLHAGACFRALIGAEAVRVLLDALDLEALATSLRARLRQAEGNQKKAIKRLHVVEAFCRAGIRPSWAVMDVIPVLPPDLRPLVILPGGRIASSDLNTLYERVLYRNQRVQHFLAVGAPTPMLHYEQRLLQDACDALFDNMRRAIPALGDNRRPLKSLTDILKGKYGRFRRHLLGKRVDYSGRSVICVGVDLQLHQCGLPKKLALELFKPFVMRKLLDRGLARSARHAKHLVERRHPLVWDQLAECLYEKVVLLNRAPTLHRLSIQAFEATLVEGDAIRLHPLVCSAFNADFDGDQMAVHLPLSEAAQAEARRLLLSTRNLRSPAAGEPSISLSQEIVLGCYYLTEDRPSTASAGRAFSDAHEARLAYEQGVIDLHTPITVRIPDQHVYDAPPPAAPTMPARQRIQTAVGRLLFNAALPTALRYRNYAMTKEQLKQLIAESLELLGEQRTAQLADDLKKLGYRYATKSGLSFGRRDMQEPVEKQMLVAQAQGQARAQEIQQEFLEGTITQEERDRRTIALWSEVTEQVSQKLLELLDPWGTIATIVKSGATKARFQQIRQLSGIRGLMANPSGRIIPIPVLGNYLVGLKTWEVFIAASGARKGFMDRSLNTAQSGYLTRKLVEVGMEVWTTCEDCGTREGWLITNQQSREMGLPDLKRRVMGRVLAEPAGSLEAGTMLDHQNVERLLARGETALRVRSPFTCRAEYGICCRCYGVDLASGVLVKQGVAVGIIAGQSIGEPGTQLTMRTFHSGGIANAQGDITQGLPRVSELFEARVPKNIARLAEHEGVVHLRKQSGTDLWQISIGAANGEVFTVELPARQTLAVTEGQFVEVGTPLTQGTINPHHLLALLGREATARYLITELQRVYRATGVHIHEKHLEVIVRQMLRYVQVTDPGDTEVLPGEVLDRFHLHATNLDSVAQGGQPATVCPLLLGLTRAALHTSSWIAAASFQETSRVLTQAAMRGQVDPLRGFKERIMLGLRIPTTPR